MEDIFHAPSTRPALADVLLQIFDLVEHFLSRHQPCRNQQGRIVHQVFEQLTVGLRLRNIESGGECLRDALKHLQRSKAIFPDVSGYWRVLHGTAPAAALAC